MIHRGCVIRCREISNTGFKLFVFLTLFICKNSTAGLDGDDIELEYGYFKGDAKSPLIEFERESTEIDCIKLEHDPYLFFGFKIFSKSGAAFDVFYVRTLDGIDSMKLEENGREGLGSYEFLERLSVFGLFPSTYFLFNIEVDGGHFRVIRFDFINCEKYIERGRRG